MQIRVDYLTTTSGPTLTLNVENWFSNGWLPYLCPQQSQIMHVNCYRLVLNLIIQYVFFYGLARLAEVCLLFFLLFICSNAPFYIRTNVVRTSFVMVGGFTLPAIAAERACATLWVSTYERNRRTYISWLLVPIVNLISVFFAILYITGVWNISYFLCIICVANLAALFIFLSCARFSVRFYLKSISYVSASARGNYSLSTRFQNIQNIRIHKIMRKLFFTSFTLNILLAIVFFLATSFNRSLLSRLNYEFFNIIIAM
uniref:G-protein coupled receptors family 1 profile domain-containing protein n=1 Tax=Ditylenchus dipsaci TaxID=166011 RepID=A0A915ELY9_9BILA